MSNQEVTSLNTSASQQISTQLEPTVSDDITIEQKYNGEEQALESHEVIELQTFSERKAWIEEKIRFLERMPPVEVFVGLDSIRSSAEVVPGLPTRAELNQWIAEHDAIEKETEIFDTGELTKLRQLTKAATQRNLSPEDTDVIELTLTTIYALDKLLHLLRDRSENLELFGIRIIWEEYRSGAWIERRQILEDLSHFINKRARWNTTIYETTINDYSPLGLQRRGSVQSFASGGSDISINSAGFSRSVRFKLAEVLSRDAAQFGSRVTALRHGKIASAGKALDKLIDNSRKPVPEELLDEQDRLEEKGINELEQIGKFAMSLVMQWRKADEIYVETMKDQTSAQNLIEEIETAKLHHPTQRQSNSFVSRAGTLATRLSVRVNPVTSPQFFPYPTHPLFEDQKEFNKRLAQSLSSDIRLASDLIDKVTKSAKEYKAMFEAVNRLDTVLEDAMGTNESFKGYLKKMDLGFSNKDGDGSPPNLSSERCLDTMRHSVFVALWPSVSESIADGIAHAVDILPELQVALTLFDASGVKDPDYRSQALVEVQQLAKMKEKVQKAYEKTITKLDKLREVRKVSQNVNGIQQCIVDLCHQVKEAMGQARWRQNSLERNLPLTPESFPSSVEDADNDNSPSPDFSKLLNEIRQSIKDDVDTPFDSLSPLLENPLKEHFIHRLNTLNNTITTCEEMIRTLASLQKQATIMNSIREECHTLQLRIEDTKLHSSIIAENIMGDVLINGHAIDDIQLLHDEADKIQTDVQSFTEGLTMRVPFVARQLTIGGTLKQRSMSADLTVTLSSVHEPQQFDLHSVDAAVRADCNSFVMRLGGEVEGLVKCKHHLTLARLAKNLDKELSETISQLYDATQELNGWKTKRDQIMLDVDLKSLNELLKVVEDYSNTNRKVINQRFSPHRDLLRQMEVSSTPLDQSIRETLYSARLRSVDDTELRFNTWVENLSTFKSKVEQAIRNELFRLDELKRVEEERRKVEAEQKAAEEREQRRLEEEQRLKEAAEREEAERLAEEARAEKEKHRLAEVEAEKARLHIERLEAERKALLEKQVAEEDRLRLTQEYSSSIEAQRLQSQREKDELAAKLRRLQEELNSTKRLQEEQNQMTAQETAKTVAEMEKQRRELEELLNEYRRKVEELKHLESQAATAQVTQTLTIPVLDDAFRLEISPVTPTPRTLGMLELEAQIHALRRRLSALGLREKLRSSKNLPTQEQAKQLRDDITSISTESANMPKEIEDSSVNAVLRSFRTDLGVAMEQVLRLEKLADLNFAFQECDNALSDLLEHIDNYPSLPETTISSLSILQLATPEEQLSARLQFTKENINTMEHLAKPVLSDARVATEHTRIMQTWDELAEMTTDKIGGKRSRPPSALGSQSSSGRTSTISMSTTSSTTAHRVATGHRKKDSYNSLRLPTQPPTRGRLLAPPNITAQRRVVSGGSETSTPRSSSRASISSSRSVSGNTFNTNTSLYQPTFSSRQRTTSLSSNNIPPISSRRQSLAPSRSRAQTGQSKRNDSPTISEASSARSSARSFATAPRSKRTSISQTPSGTWGRAPRDSLSSILSRPITPQNQRKDRPPVRKKYVPNPKSKLDVAVGDVVNNLPVGINVEGLTETWKDQSGKYWIGNQDAKLCFCRILRSQTVMVRVGGGWSELSKFIKDHFADSFRLLPESPPRPGAGEEKWISSASLLSNAETKSPPAPPKTPEPKLPFVPSFSLLSPSGQSPRSIASSPSTKGSPLTPLQFMRRAEPDPTMLRPVTPTKQNRSGPHASLRLWRP